MAYQALAQIDIDNGRRLVKALDSADGGVDLKVKAAGWIYSNETRDWRLYIVSPLVDQKGQLWALLALHDAMLSRDLSGLARRVHVVGRKEEHAAWLQGLRPIGSRTKLADLQIDSTTGPVESAFIYRSL